MSGLTGRRSALGSICTLTSAGGGGGVDWSRSCTSSTKSVA
jgi:hypothetical protein